MKTADPLTHVGDVEINTPQLAAALKKTGAALGMAGVRAFQIDEAIAGIVELTELGVEDLARYNAAYGDALHGAALGVLGGSPLRKPGDFRLLVAQVVAARLTAAGIPVHEPGLQGKWTTVRAAIDKMRGLSLLALTQNWRSESPSAETADPDEAA